MTGSGMSSVSKEMDRLGTPSTSSGATDDTPDLRREIPMGGDTNQWIRKP
jgi:hypothetical protein